MVCLRRPLGLPKKRITSIFLHIAFGLLNKTADEFVIFDTLPSIVSNTPYRCVLNGCGLNVFIACLLVIALHRLGSSRSPPVLASRQERGEGAARRRRRRLGWHRWDKAQRKRELALHCLSRTYCSWCYHPPHHSYHASSPFLAPSFSTSYHLSPLSPRYFSVNSNSRRTLLQL